MGDCLVVILAAGLGTRMKSALPKVMHPIGGEPMIAHVLRHAIAASDRRAVVVGPGMEVLEKAVSAQDDKASLFVQTDRLGTAHAALSARDAFAGADQVLVMFGDSPFVTSETLFAARNALQSGADVTVTGFYAADPTGYGRILEENGRVTAIREEAAASEAEKAIPFCNSGLMGFQGAHLPALLDAIGSDNPKNEFYLTDAVEIAAAKGLRVAAIEGPEAEFMGINSRAQLADAEAEFQSKRRADMMANGVTLVAPETVYFSAGTTIGRDTVIEPNVVFAGMVEIGTGATIKGFSHIENTRLGDRVTIGPFARLRPGTVVEEGAKIGNFVETKAATVSKGAKVNHLSYIGDATIGAAANIGAGTITCNYDGFRKHHTEIGAGAFIGSNSALVAPVEIGEGAYVGSGSVITIDVPKDALAVGRGRQSNKDGWAAAFRRLMTNR